MAEDEQEATTEPIVLDIMERDVISIAPDATVADLAALFHRHHIKGVPVVDGENRLVGIVTEGDLAAQDADLDLPPAIDIFGTIVYLGSMRRFEERLKKAVGALVGDVMTKDVYKVGPGATVREVATLMRDHNVNRIPVVDDDGHLVGIVTRSDVVRSMGL